MAATVVSVVDLTPMAQRSEHASPLQARKQDLVRQAIWDAAVDLFARTGFEETTTDEIARTAGVSPRTFFRYFSSKSDLMAQGMVTYRALLTHAIRSAPDALGPIQVVRHTARQVAVEAASHPRTRKLVRIASTSAAAREAQLSRRGEVENGIAQEFAVKCRTARGDDMTARLLAALTLTVIDVTFREWAKHADWDIGALTDDVLVRLTALLADRPPTPRGKRTAKRGRISKRVAT